MLITNSFLITNKTEKEVNGNTYYGTSIISLDDGDSYTMNIDKSDYEKIKPMTKYDLQLELINNPKFGMKLKLKNILKEGNSIIE